MKLKQAGSWILLALLAIGLMGCTSDAARERQQQREAVRKVAEDVQDAQAKDNSERADLAVMLREQERLDAVEQKRTRDVYAHSCRKVTMGSYALNATNVDTSQCSPEQLKLEQEAESRQALDKVFENSAATHSKH